MSSGLWQRVRDGGLATVAVMGMAKNTGKTVTLNHLMACAAREHVCLGLSSIGRDGEETDAVFSFPKPPVLVWPGTVVATARDTLVRARVRTRYLAGTGIGSPMGEIVLVQVLDAGEMEVAGASRSADQITTIEQLRRCGAELVFLDGALGRRHLTQRQRMRGAALRAELAEVGDGHLERTGHRLVRGETGVAVAHGVLVLVGMRAPWPRLRNPACPHGVESTG